MTFSREQLLFIIERVGETTVVAPTDAFPFRVSRRGSGYSNEKLATGTIGGLQARLSIMLEMSRSEHADAGADADANEDPVDDPADAACAARKKTTTEKKRKR